MKELASALKLELPSSRKGGGTYTLGEYTLKVKGGMVFVYKGVSPFCPIKLNSLPGLFTRKTLAKNLGVEQGDLDKLTSQILLDTYNEAKEENGDKEKEEFPPEVEEKADEFLNDPALLHRIDKTLDCRLCGEHENRLFMTMAGCGARQKTSIVRLEGPNASGKKMLYYWLPGLFGEENVIILSSATFAYLKRKALEGWDSRGKIIVCVEERGDFAGIIKYTFEQVYSEDKINFGMNVKNEETHEWEPVEITLQGPLLFVISSTEPEQSLHAESREWSVKPDPNLEQTKNVDKWWRERELKPKSKIEEEEREIQLVRCALSKLEPCQVKVPFVDQIIFPLEYLTDRRKSRDFDNLIRFSAFIHKKQRPIVNETVYALPHDFYIAKAIANKILAVSRGDLSPDEEALLAFIRSHSKELNMWTMEGRKPDENHLAECFKVSDIAERKEYRHTHERTLRDTLNSLAKKRRIGKNVINRSNVVYYNLPVEVEFDSPSPSMGPVSPKELVSAIVRVEELTGEDEEKLYSQVANLMATPFVDPIKGIVYSSSQLHSSSPSKPESEPSSEKKPVEVEGAPISPSPSPVSKPPEAPLGLRAEDIIRLARLYPPEKGKCVGCGKDGTLDFQVETEEGIFGFVCDTCAFALKRENSEAEWLE